MRLSYEAHHRLLANQASRRRLVARPPVLSDAQQRVLGELREHGIAFAHFDQLIGDSSLWQALRSDIDAFVRETEGDGSTRPEDPTAPRKKKHLISRSLKREKELESRGVSPPFPRLEATDPWVRLALAGPIVDTVNAYRGMCTKLYNMDQWYTVPVRSDQERVGAQAWHRDPEDLNVVKVFVYFSRVDDHAGPLEYIRGSTDGGRYGHLWPWSITHGVYPSQEELLSQIPESDVVSATGGPGTIIFCDTSGLHRGGFATRDPRILSVNTYLSPAAYIARRAPRRFRVEPPGDIPDAARFALT